MGAGQLIQGLFTLFIASLRFIGLILSQIPGTKHILKYLPWHNDKDFEKPDINAWKKDVKTWDDLRNEHRNSPESLETMRRARLTKRGRAIEDNKSLTRTQFKQPSHITLTTKINGKLV